MKVFRHPRSGQTVTFSDDATEEEISARLAEVDFNRNQDINDLRQQQQQVRQEELPASLKLAQFGASLGAAGANTLLAPLRMTGQLSGTMHQMGLPSPFSFLLNKIAPMPDGSDTYAAFWEETSKMIEESANIDPNAGLLTRDLPSGVGSMLGMALTGGSGMLGRMGNKGRAMLTGAINGYVANYDRAKASGADELSSIMNGLTGAVIGTSEAWTLTKWLDRFGMRTGTSVAQRVPKLRRWLTEAGQESGQEFGQNLAEDLSAAAWTPEDLDFARSIRGAGRGAAVGFLIGGGMSSVSQGVEGRNRASRLEQIRESRRNRGVIEDLTLEGQERAGRTVEMAAKTLPQYPGGETRVSPRDISMANTATGMDIGYGYLGHWIDREGKFDRSAAEEQISKAINNTLQGQGTATFIQNDGTQTRLISAERTHRTDDRGRIIASPMQWMDQNGRAFTVDDISNGGTLQLRGYTRQLPALATKGLRNVKPSVPTGAPMPVETDVMPPSTLRYSQEEKARWSPADPSSILWLGQNHQTRLGMLISDMEQKTTGRQMTREEREQYLWWRFQRHQLQRWMNEGATGKRDPKKVLNDIADLLQLRVDHSAGFPIASYPQYAKDEIGKAGALLTKQGEPTVVGAEVEAEGGAAQPVDQDQAIAQAVVAHFPGTEGQWDVAKILESTDPATPENLAPDVGHQKGVDGKRTMIRLIDPNDPSKVVRVTYEGEVIGSMLTAGVDPETVAMMEQIGAEASKTTGRPAREHQITGYDAVTSLLRPGTIVKGLQSGGTASLEKAIAHGWVVHPADAHLIPGYKTGLETRIPSLEQFQESRVGQGPTATLSPDDAAFRTKLSKVDESEVQLAALAAGVVTGKNHRETLNNMAKAASLSKKVLRMSEEELSKDTETMKQALKLFKAPGAAPRSDLAKATLVRDLLVNFRNYPSRLSAQRYEQFLLHTLNYRGDLTQDEITKIADELSVINPQLGKTVKEQTKGKKAGQFSFKTILPATVLNEFQEGKAVEERVARTAQRFGDNIVEGEQVNTPHFRIVYDQVAQEGLDPMSPEGEARYVQMTRESEAGFITTKGRFVSREEAAELEGATGVGIMGDDSTVGRYDSAFFDKTGQQYPRVAAQTAFQRGARRQVPIPVREMFTERLGEQEAKQTPTPTTPATAPTAAQEPSLPGDPIPTRVDVANIPTQADGMFVYIKGSTDGRIFRAVQSEDPALLVLRDNKDKLTSAGKDAVQRVSINEILNSREARIAAGVLKRSDLPEIIGPREVQSVSQQMGIPANVLLQQARALEGQGGQLGRLKTQPLLGLVKVPLVSQPHPSTATIRVVDSKGQSHIVPRDSFQPVKVNRKVKTPTATQRRADRKTPPIQPGLDPAQQPSKESTDNPVMGTEAEKVEVQQQGTTSNEDTPPPGRNTPPQQKGMVAVPRATEPQATTAFKALINNAEFLAQYPHAGELLRAGMDYYPRSWPEGRKAAETIMQAYSPDAAGMETAFGDFSVRNTLYHMADSFRPYIFGELLRRNRVLRETAGPENQARHIAIEEAVWQFLTLNQSVAGQTLQASQYILSQFSPNFIAAKLNLQFKKYWKGDMTQEQHDKIGELVSKLQSSYEGVQSSGIPKSRAYAELVDYVEKNITITPWDKWNSWWYSSVLSSMATQFENVLTAVNVLTNGFMGAINSNDPVTGFYFYLRGLTNLTDLNQLASTYKVFHEIPSEHFNKLEDAGVYDYVQRRGELTPARIVTAAIRRQWLKNAIERNREAGGARRLLNVVAVPVRNINVLMSAVDFTLAQIGSDQKAALLAIKDNKRGDATTAEYRKKIREIISTDRESMEAAKREAVLEAKAGYINASDIPLRARELALKKRPDQIIELADRYGLEVTGNIEPYGFPGTIYRGFLQLRREAPALRIVTPFMRYAANWTNTTINFLPAVGLGRYAMHQFLRNREYKFLGHEFSKIDPDMSEAQELDMMQRMRMQGLVGFLALSAALYAAIEGLDDENPWVQFTGSFKFLPPAKRKELMNAGIMPYQIRIAGMGFSYRQTPFSAPLAIAGEIADRARYDTQPMDFAEMGSRFLGALSTGAIMTLDMPSLVGLSDLLMAANPRNYRATDTDMTSGINYIGELLKRYTTGAVIPGFIKDVDQWFDPHVKDRASLGFVDWLTRDIPIARRGVHDSINVLGDPVKNVSGPWRRFIGPSPEDLAPTPEDVPLYAEMQRRNQQGVFIPWALEVTFPRADGLRVKLTDADAYTYRKAVATAMKQTLQQNLEWFKGLSRDDAQLWLRQKHGELSNWVANSFDWNPENAE